MPVPDTTAERVLQAVRAWLAVSAKAGGSLDDARVIPADGKGARPDLPYLTVKVLVHDVPVGVDEDFDGTADAITVATAAAGTVYSFALDGATIAYARLAGDSNTSIAAELAIRARADRLTVDVAATGTTYSFRVDGQVVSYVRAAGNTEADVASALALAANALAGVYASSYGALVYVAADAGPLRVTETSSDLAHVASETWAVSSGAVLYVTPITGTLTVASVSAGLTLTADAVPVRNVNAHRSGTVSVQGFGRETAAWLERATMRLRMGDVRAILDAEGVTVDTLGGVQDLSALIDTSIEGRYLREYAIGYQLRTEPEILSSLANVELISGSEFWSEANDPSPLPALVTAPTGY